MTPCEIEIGDAYTNRGTLSTLGGPCGKYAQQKCSDCGIAICDTHCFICCDKTLCSGCLAEHQSGMPGGGDL